jgi:predicted Zn-ribbon and HTH transcriptional regulator
MNTRKHIDCDKCGMDGYVAAFIPLKQAWCPHCKSSRIRLFVEKPDYDPGHYPA